MSNFAGDTRWDTSIAEPAGPNGVRALIISQPAVPQGVNAAPLIAAPQLVAILPEEIDSLIERLQLEKQRLAPPRDRGIWVCLWPEALRQLQHVINGDLENDDDHELLIEIANTAGLDRNDDKDDKP